MEKALKILNSEQDPDEISRACQIAVDVMKKCKQTKYDQWPEKFNIDQVTSCLMTVFLSNFENLCHVLTSATDALIHLIQLNPKSKIDLARKGIFFNIVKLFWFQNTSSREVCALSSLRLSVALVDDCHHNLLSCKDADLISLVPDALTLYEDDKYILVNCLQLLSILLCETENDNFEIKEWRNSWKKLCFINSVYICVLDIMNKYVADTPMLQLFSLKCLKAFTGGAIKQMQEHGVIDTILHTCDRHDGDSAVELEAFQLLEIIMEKASYEEVESHVSSLCRVTSVTLLKYCKDIKMLGVACNVLKHIILLDGDTKAPLMQFNLVSVVFQVLVYHYDKMTHYDKYQQLDTQSSNEICFLYDCIYLMVADNQNDLRNEVLMSAFRNGDIDLALSVLFLGANINYKSKNGLTPLKIACQQQDETMVKRIIWFVASLQQVGLWKSRLENLSSPLEICMENGNYNIAYALLWYLHHRDNNGVAEWSRLGLGTLKVEWLEMSLSGRKISNQQPNIKTIIAISSNKSFLLANKILMAGKDKPTSEKYGRLTMTDLLNERFSDLSDFALQICPLKRFQTLAKKLLPTSKVEEKFNSNNHHRDHSELKDLSVELLCSRCSKLTPFRDVLKLSFDEETLLEERLHKAPVEMCTCHVTFPPPNLENTTLKEIHLAHNKLSTVEPFSELTQSTKSRLFHSTTHLFLQNNQISSFPRKVALIFKHLVELSLSNNKLTTFPFEVLKHCTHLETLDVSENQIKDSFPMFLLNPVSFKEITEKGTGENQRKSSKVTHPLKTLKLGCNCLVLFPLWVPPILSKLIHLDLKQNEIASFISPDNCCDEELGSSAMLHLKSLNLSRNKISTIFPSSFVCMPSLTHLDVSENRIEKVDNFSQDDRLLVKLENLNLSGNLLAEIPQIVPLLPNLRCLSLSNNIIKHVPVPKLWKTKQLKELDLSHNAISDISDLANMLPSYWSSLRSLNLANNQINLLFPSIGDLKNLEILDISHNQLKTLPDEIGHLNRLMKLGIKENNLNLDNSIINGRAQDICKFLYARLKKSVPQNSLKLMLVGDAGAGKTTLLQSLIKAKTKTRRLSESLAVSVSGVLDTRQQTVLATVGVDVVDLPLKHSNGVFQLSAWDFAGQEDFFATHPCFLSERAMYVAVYDASKGPEQLHTLKPWLTAIHARATFCPVLVVGTHSDMLPFKTKQETISLLNQELETLSHQEWFPQGACKYDLLLHELVDVREGSSGIYRLKAVIADIVANSVVNGHPLVGSMIPHSYVQLSEILMEEAAKRETFPVISYNELANLIHKKSNEQNPQFESGSELMLAVRYLHQTGVLLHFDDPRSRLRDCFFIKPVWLCQLLARVTTMKEDKSFKINPYINHEGILSKTQFQRNFINERTIDSKIASQFLPRLFRLLENFEVILWQGGDHYLVPSKLPNKKPEFALPVCQVSKKLIRFFSMIYVPMGFWPRLIARLLAFEEKLLLGYNSSFITAPNLTPSVRKIWKEGLYLEWEAHNSKQKPFVLVQAGCQEFEAQTSYHDEPLKHLAQSSQTQAEGFEMVNFGGNISKQEGLEVVVSRDSAGKILLGQLVDHINGLIEEWYPGLLKTDMRGQCLFQQFCPCLGCVDLNAFTPTKVKIYCIGDIAESILCNKSLAGISSQSNHKPLIRKSDGIYLTCLNHQDTPARVADFAPEINLDDFDKTLHLNPQMLDFRQTPSRILGDGGFGSVYQATYDGEEVAVKTFHILTADMSYKMLRAELHVLAQYHHPSVVALKGFIPPAYSTPNLPLPLLALEYAKYGSLGKLLKDTAQLPVEARKSALPLALKHRVAYDITDGLCFLHSRNIIYRDMKPDNILLVSLDPLSPATAKITDYGIATLVSPFGTPGPSGTPGYSAPEVVTLKTGGKDKPSDLFPYSSKCDIYSFGLVFHEIAVGMSPWVDYVYQVCSTQGFTTSTLSEPDDIIMKGILPSAISSYEGAESWPCAEQLITNCLLHNPDERPTSHQIVSILSKVDSLGLRMSSPLHQSKVMCTALHPFSHANILSPVKRSFSVPYDKLPKGPHETATVSSLTLCFTPVQPSHEKPGQKLVMQTILDLSKGHIVQENVFTKLEDHHDVTCILSLPKSPGENVEYMEKTKNTKPSSYTNSMLLFGTKQGCLLLLSESEISVKTRFSCQVESVFLHQPYSPKTLRHSFSTSSPHVQSVCFVVIGLENACMAIFPLEKIITQDTINPLHEVSLCDVASHSPITAITAVNGAAMYATCGRHIVSLRVSSSGQPTILASFQARDNIDNFVVGLHHMYVNAHASSSVEVWRVGSACLKSSIDTKQVVLSDNEKLQEIDVVVTCLTYHQHNPSLWVGLSSGHMIVYSDPHHNPLAIVRRHYGPITQLLALEEDESSLSKGVVVCIGEGMRSFSRDLEETSEVDGFGETRKNKIPPRKLTSSYATIWDADLPAKASNLYDILAARRAYSNSA